MKSNAVHSILSKQQQNQQTTTEVKDLMANGFIRIQAAKKTGNHMACKRLIKPKRQRQADMLEQQPGSPNDARPEHELSPDPETESTTDHAPESGSESDSDSEQELESEPESDEDRVEFDLDEFMESNL